MRFKEYNIGSYRWHIDAIPESYNELITFKSWLMDNFPNCMCKLRYNQTYASINVARYFEVRGSNIGAIATIKLTWG